MIKKSSIISPLLAALCLISATALYAGTLYVKADGNDSNTGSSWLLAKQTVQKTIDAAATGDQIWVAKGTYVEQITLKDGVALYGGFQGTEKSLDERPAFPRPSVDPNKTILSGNKVRTVVIASGGLGADTRIDGFTIRDGGDHPINAVPTGNGGGIYCSHSSPTIANNSFCNNWASYGGAIWCGDSSSPAIINNLFATDISTGDYSWANYGVAVACIDSSPTISGNVFKALDCTYAAIYAKNSSPVVSGNSFVENRRAIYCEMSSTPWIENNTMSFGSNSAIYCIGSSPTIIGNVVSGYGKDIYPDSPFPRAIYCSSSTAVISRNTVTGNFSGGIQCNNSTVTIDGNIITGNISQGQNGGGIYCTASNVVITGNTISENKAPFGGVSCESSSSATIVDNVVSNNEAYQNGGGILASTAVVVTNNTIVGNKGTKGGGIGLSGSPKVYNNIIAFNSSGFFRGSSGTPVISNNCVYNPDGANYTGTTAGPGDISVNPLLANRTGGDYHLLSGSPCINAGSLSVVGLPTFDMDGEDRVFGNKPDIGADEAWPVVMTPTIAKSAVDGARARNINAVVTAVFADDLYIESLDRASGILLKSPGKDLAEGTKVTLTGKMSTTPYGERYIVAETVTPGNSGAVTPLGISNMTLGGGKVGYQDGIWGWRLAFNPITEKFEKAWSQSNGLNTIGLLVRCWGKVLSNDGIYSINDGSGNPVKLILPAGVTIDSTWEYIVVTGISSCEKVDNQLVRIIKVRKSEDIQKLK